MRVERTWEIMTLRINTECNVDCIIGLRRTSHDTVSLWTWSFIRLWNLFSIFLFLIFPSAIVMAPDCQRFTEKKKIYICSLFDLVCSHYNLHLLDVHRIVVAFQFKLSSVMKKRGREMRVRARWLDTHSTAFTHLFLITFLSLLHSLHLSELRFNINSNFLSSFFHQQSIYHSPVIFLRNNNRGMLLFYVYWMAWKLRREEDKN